MHEGMLHKHIYGASPRAKIGANKRKAKSFLGLDHKEILQTYQDTLANMQHTIVQLVTKL
jgi:hypothetical protein